MEKLRALLKKLQLLSRVAYSGGVDSVFLARVAHEALGDKSLAAIADSASLPRRELAEALDIATKFSFSLFARCTRRNLNNNGARTQARIRCYFCKRHDVFLRN